MFSEDFFHDVSAITDHMYLSMAIYPMYVFLFIFVALLSYLSFCHCRWMDLAKSVTLSSIVKESNGWDPL